MNSEKFLLVEIDKEISSVTTRPFIVAYLEPCQTYKTEGLTKIVKSASMSSEKSYWCKSLERNNTACNSGIYRTWSNI